MGLGQWTSISDQVGKAAIFLLFLMTLANESGANTSSRLAITDWDWRSHPASDQHRRSPRANNVIRTPRRALPIVYHQLGVGMIRETFDPPHFTKTYDVPCPSQ